MPSEPPQAAAALWQDLQKLQGYAAELGRVIARARDAAPARSAASDPSGAVRIGVIVVKFVAAMVTAIAALGSVVFSWAGAALIVEEAGVNTAAIAGLVATLLALLGDQVKERSALQNAASSDKFPRGAWPVDTR